jgi:two-component system nitrate/nitrite response regulator NarL
MQPGPIGTVLIGPNILLREGLSRILIGAGFRILASASRANDPVLSSLSQEKPILLINDVSNDFDTALRQIEFFKRRYPASRVAVLSHQHRLTEMLSAFRLGVNAYLVNVANCDTFIKSLELVMLGVTLLPPEILAFISDRQGLICHGRTTDLNHHAAAEDNADHEGTDGDSDDDAGSDGVVGTEIGANEDRPPGKSSYTPPLSARQQSILRCLIQGDSNKTIARKIGISEATVKVHVKAILRRIRVHNRTQAAIWAISNGPFISAKDDTSDASDELPVEPFPNLDAAQILSKGYRNGSKSLPTLQLKGTTHVGLSSIMPLAHKGIGRKNH